MVNHTLVVPSYRTIDLTCCTYLLLISYAPQDQCAANLHKQQLASSAKCRCRQLRMMMHILELHQPTKFVDDALVRLHHADKDAVIWLTNQWQQHLWKEMKLHSSTTQSLRDIINSSAGKIQFRQLLVTEVLISTIHTFQLLQTASHLADITAISTLTKPNTMQCASYEKICIFCTISVLMKKR